MHTLVWSLIQPASTNQTAGHEFVHSQLLADKSTKIHTVPDVVFPLNVLYSGLLCSQARLDLIIFSPQGSNLRLALLKLTFPVHANKECQTRPRLGHATNGSRR